MFLLLNINLFPGHLVELTSTEKITELQQYLMTRYSNKSFWVGSSDLENEGTFRWFYSGDLFSSDLWSRKPRDDNHCVRMDDSFLKFSADECVNKNYFICEVGPNLLGQGYQIFLFSTHRRSMFQSTTTQWVQRAAPGVLTPWIRGVITTTFVGESLWILAELAELWEGEWQTTQNGHGRWELKPNLS